MHFALLLSQNANIHRDPKKQRQPFKVDDFLLRRLPGRTAPPAPLEPKPKQTLADMKRFAAAMTTGLGGEIVQKDHTNGA